jgi:hypothetical protein
VIRVLGRQQGLAAAVHTDPVQMPEVRIAPGLLALAREVDRPRALVHVDDVHHVAAARRYAILEPAGGEIVEVQVDPVLALRPPDQLLGFGQ